MAFDFAISRQIAEGISSGCGRDLVKEQPMKAIFNLAAYAGKVLCLVVLVGAAQASGLSAFAAMSAAFIGQFSVTPSGSRTAKAGNVLTDDAGARTSP
jgi:hypothetical protein